MIDGTRVLRHVSLRLLPFMFLLYIVAYLDRINLGFAAAQMKGALAFDDETIGAAGSVFFFGYLLFQVPSNLILERLGARRWIATIMVAWGLVSGATAFVPSRNVFLVLRFLLGVAEAGFFPGMILYLTYWFPQRERACAVSWFMTATALAGVVGGVISGPLLALSWAGLAGWQWLYLLEAAPAVVLGFVVLVWLPDGPRDARWLSPAERDWVTAALQADRPVAEAVHAGAAIRDKRVWLLSAIYFSIMVDLYGISLWLPQIIRGHVSDETLVGHLAAIPYVLAAIAIVAVGRHSDRSGERRWHVIAPALLGAVGFLLTTLAGNTAVAVCCLSLAAFGLWGTFGPFWALPTACLEGRAAAAGIAVVNSIGNLGGSLGVYAIGVIKQNTNSFNGGLVLMACALLATAGLTLLARTSGRAARVEEAR